MAQASWRQLRPNWRLPLLTRREARCSSTSIRPRVVSRACCESGRTRASPESSPAAQPGPRPLYRPRLDATDLWTCFRVELDARVYQRETWSKRSRKNSLECSDATISSLSPLPPATSNEAQAALYPHQM